MSAVAYRRLRHIGKAKGDMRLGMGFCGYPTSEFDVFYK